MIDLLLTGGRRLNLDTGVTEPVTIGITGDRISHLGVNAPTDTTVEHSLDVSGALVLPGLIDLHTHAHWGVRLGINVDKVAAVSGVTTWVDAGTSGAGTFEGFLRHVVDTAQARILAFVNLSYLGLAPADMLTREVGELEDPRFADLAAIARVAEEFPGAIRGIKLRASENACGSSGPVVLPLAREAADLLGVPLMMHVGMAPPTLAEALPYLREGDVLTHCFHPHAAGCILDAQRRPKPEVREAHERGVRLDVGHGVASMSYAVASAAMEHGLLPHTLSSDIHSQNVGPIMPSLLAVLETFLALGMPLHEVIRRCTTAAADTLGEPSLGRLQVGGPADLAVLAPESTAYQRQDVTGARLKLPVQLRHLVTIAGGRLIEPFDDGRVESRPSPWQTRFGADHHGADHHGADAAGEADKTGQADKTPRRAGSRDDGPTGQRGSDAWNV